MAAGLQSGSPRGVVSEPQMRSSFFLEGVNELKERELTSLEKEGWREAAGWFDQEINYWTNTTPALRATPPLLRRGISLCAEHVRQFGGESPLPNLMEVKG